ncbi:hypothetical protein BBBOND_0313750 [Babesia bigemina]|uniref:Uncharacterized protein n=1 Tax=Babesia bigemina TaxID=5866 RepID=A0A061DA99_BABBI|nr:hypothetical protein BBBOND_0313750 [Babesia bigemina]CDR97473.1 hypothetical protein BBBOND_0313750 [Babesia bigemina]|eukprot:XP_012769659.1 hypothetical protein BBBOND_0313750 [Babesia bigemina]
MSGWLRGLGAAVVVLQLVEGSGSGSGSVAVEGTGSGSGSVAVEGSGSGSGSVAVEGTGSGSGSVAVEGTGSGSGSVAVGELRGLGGTGEDEWTVGLSIESAVGEEGIAIPMDVKSRAGFSSTSSHAASLPRVEQHSSGRELSASSPNSSSPAVIPYIIVPVTLVIVVICVMIYFRIRPFHRMISEVTTPSPPYSAIAAVIVAIIVAIIIFILIDGLWLMHRKHADDGACNKEFENGCKICA